MANGRCVWPVNVTKNPWSTTVEYPLGTSQNSFQNGVKFEAKSLPGQKLVLENNQNPDKSREKVYNGAMDKCSAHTAENSDALPENPRFLSCRIFIRQQDDDPNEGEGIRFINENFDAIWSNILKDERLWAYIKENPENIIGHKINMGEFTVNVSLDFRAHVKDPVISMQAVKTKWMNQREAEIKSIFPDQSGNNPNTQELTKRLSITSREDLSIVDTNFNPDTIKDGLGRGLDAQIIELVRILNMTGIKTVMSCAGHPKSKNRNARLPFISMRYSSLPNFISAISQWKGANNLTFFNVGLGIVYCTVPTGTPLEKAQRTFGELTDFLAQQINNEHESTLTPVEIQQRVRRQNKRQLLL